RNVKIFFAVVSSVAAVACDTTIIAETPSSTPSALPHLEQAKIVRRFSVLESGGTIDFETLDPLDSVTLALLQKYKKPLEESLRNGNFELLRELVPETAEFTKWVRDNRGVGFSVSPLPAGIRLDITSASQSSRTAVHQFISRVRGTPLTPEEKRANHPGNELGRDARPVEPGQ
ncbi:MAG: hypothetical protein M3N48_14265, partial [Verrucomicrobiota bacterium]|nr:hypothetical protein [Verrucomicrobiota bacterium]